MRSIIYVSIAIVAIMLTSLMILYFGRKPRYKKCFDTEEHIRCVASAAAFSICVVIILGSALAIYDSFNGFNVSESSTDTEISSSSNEMIPVTTVEDVPLLTIEDIEKFPSLIGKIGWVQIKAGEYVSTNINFGADGYMSTESVPFGTVDIDETVIVHYDPATMDMWLVKDGQFYNLAE